MEAARPGQSDVLQAIDRILLYTEEGQEEFFDEPLIQEAVCRNLEIVRRGCRALDPLLSARFRLLRMDSPLSGWCNSGDEYFGGGRDLVWSLLEEELSRLKETVRELVLPRVSRR